MEDCYTFRVLCNYRPKGNLVFECCKWGAEKDPIIEYNVVVRPRSFSCNCFARGECRHIEMARTILANNMIPRLHTYIWKYDGSFETVEDLLHA